MARRGNSTEDYTVGADMGGSSLLISCVDPQLFKHVGVQPSSAGRWLNLSTVVLDFFAVAFSDSSIVNELLRMDE